MKRDEQARLFNASHKLFFRPSDTEFDQYAKILENQTGRQSEHWKRKLASLDKGQCISIGLSRSEGEGGNVTPQQFEINIDSLENRFPA